MRRRGFTLIEALTILALIALLVGMLSPALAKSRQRAIAAQCAAHLRQLGTLHLDPLGREHWGNSPYDLPENEDSGAHEPVDRNGGGGGGEPPFSPPRRVEGERGFSNDGRLDGGIDGGHFGGGGIQALEDYAVDQPKYWKLLCPEAASHDLNSYGMYYRAVEAPMTVLATSRDLIFGCSDYKVVDVASNFAFRHLRQANFYFGDHHVEIRGTDLFTPRQMMASSNRPAPKRGPDRPHHRGR